MCVEGVVNRVFRGGPKTRREISGFLWSAVCRPGWVGDLAPRKFLCRTNTRRVFACQSRVFGNFWNQNRVRQMFTMTGWTDRAEILTRHSQIVGHGQLLLRFLIFCLRHFLWSCQKKNRAYDVFFSSNLNLGIWGAPFPSSWQIQTFGG